MSEPLTHPDDVDLAWPGPTERAHLDGCARCRQRAMEVAAVQQRASLALAPLTGPVPVPPEVARRVEAALAAAGSGHDRAGARPGRSGWLLAAAAAALVVVAAAVVVPRLGGGVDTTALQADGQESADRVGAATSALPAPDPLVPGVPALPAALLERANEIDGPAAAPPGCGQALAGALDGTVVAALDPASPEESGVLVVLTVPAAGPDRQAWWLPTCAAGPEQAWGASAVR